MSTKLSLYNQALIELGQRALSAVDENREDRRTLDAVYDSVVEDCLEQGQWNFAIRAVKIEADTTITPAFGFTEVFGKPSDWVRTVGLSTDEHHNCPLTGDEMRDEAGVWLADTTPLYARYVSNDASYGLDLTAWPVSFERFVELELASRIAVRITASDKLHKKVYSLAKAAKRNALNKDAMNEGIRFPPTGRLLRSRMGWQSRRDRGNRSSFTG